MNDAQKDQLFDVAVRAQAVAKKHKEKILVGTTVVATVAALRYRSQLREFQKLLLLEVRPDQLELLKQGGAGVYDIDGLEVIVRGVPKLAW